MSRTDRNSWETPLLKAFYEETQPPSKLESFNRIKKSFHTVFCEWYIFLNKVGLDNQLGRAREKNGG